MHKEQYWLQEESTRKYETCYCKHFGCGKILSLIERLAGGKCTEHMQGVKVDPVKVISYK